MRNIPLIELKYRYGMKEDEYILCLGVAGELKEVPNKELFYINDLTKDKKTKLEIANMLERLHKNNVVIFESDFARFSLGVKFRKIFPDESHHIKKEGALLSRKQIHLILLIALIITLIIMMVS